jgi:hypothetical protein
MFPEIDGAQKENFCPYCNEKLSSFARRTCGSEECKRLRNLDYTKRIATMNARRKKNKNKQNETSEN